MSQQTTQGPTSQRNQVEWTRASGLTQQTTSGSGRALQPSYTVTSHTANNLEAITLSFAIPAMVKGTSTTITSSTAYLSVSATVKMAPTDQGQFIANALGQPQVSGAVCSGIALTFGTRTGGKIPASGTLANSTTYTGVSVVGTMTLFAADTVATQTASVPVTVILMGATTTSFQPAT